MGKRLIQQARGKGGPRYRAPSFRYKGRAAHKGLTKETVQGQVMDILHCSGHTSPLTYIIYEDGEECLSFAPEGIKVGDKVSSGPEADVDIGNTTALRNLPVGSLVYNLESLPGDGGKFVRSSGTFARIVTKTSKKITIELPSKRQRTFSPECRACVGVVAGGGRLDKPILKAGTKHFKMKAKNKLWPKVSGAAQNAVDHPFGNSRSSRKSKARPVPK
ncbi:50S ribosomal protein L2, partial [Candidatus Woesearchaeota archaeon]|nr:50S ribosomal protein L2 [Candidatus Woesearchaeota archaeon]